MINFNETKEVPSSFGGSELKKAMLYQDDVYMVKFPDPVREAKNELSYMNNQFSEHIGCEIFKLCGIPVQETKLGYYNVNGKEKIVVACKDFRKEYGELIEFSKIANANVSSDKKAKLTIEDLYDTINNCALIENKVEIIEKFWDVFVVDTFIGNLDRHYTNWGLVNNDNKLTFAPVYDCGSSLSPLLTDDKKSHLLKDDSALKSTEYNLCSVYAIEGKRICYHEILKNPPDDLERAIKRIVPTINMDKISTIINNVEVMPNVHKEYMIKSLNLRNDMMLQPALKRILKKKKLTQEEPKRE